MRHAISVLLENEVGALTRVTGMFSSRGYNIDSLNVAATDNPMISRVTLVVSGTDEAIAKLNTQLAKLVPETASVYQFLLHCNTHLTARLSAELKNG